MKPLISLKNRFPVLYGIFGLVLLYLTVRIVAGFRLPLALTETINAVIILAVWFLFNTKEERRFRLTGLKESLRFMRVYLIFLAVVCGISIIASFAFGRADKSYFNALLSYLVVGCTVGIVEELPCRGMLYAGIRDKLGVSRRSVIIAALVSGFAFGFIHVLEPIMLGGVSGILGWAQVATKTLGAGAFGFVMCFIYQKHGNIWPAVIIHGLNDLLEFWMSAAGSESSTAVGQYVVQDTKTAVQVIIVGLISFAIYIPYIVKCLRDKNIVPEDDEQLSVEEETAE